MKMRVTALWNYKNGDPGKTEQVVRGKKQAANTSEYLKGWLLAHKRAIRSLTVEEVQ